MIYKEHLIKHREILKFFDEINKFEELLESTKIISQKKSILITMKKTLKTMLLNIGSDENTITKYIYEIMNEENNNKNEILLGKGYKTIINEENYNDLIKYQWYSRESKHTIYVTGIANGLKTSMHRHLMNHPKNETIDHINNNALDNRKENLRICSIKQNSLNLNRKSLAQYSGVRLKSRWGNIYYDSIINVNNKPIHLGTFINVVDAAKAFDMASLFYHKEFASTNFEYENREYLIKTLTEEDVFKYAYTIKKYKIKDIKIIQNEAKEKRDLLFEKIKPLLSKHTNRDIINILSISESILIKILREHKNEVNPLKRSQVYKEKQKQLWEEQNSELKSFIEKNINTMTYIKIAELYNVSLNKISNIVKKYEIKRDHKFDHKLRADSIMIYNQKVEKEKQEMFEKLLKVKTRKELMTITNKEIMKILGCCYDTASYILTKNGINRAKMGNVQQWEKKDINNIKNLLKKGKTQKQIAEIYNVSSTRISTVLRKYGEK